jgi:hypothetical protein
MFAAGHIYIWNLYISVFWGDFLDETLLLSVKTNGSTAFHVLGSKFLYKLMDLA